MNSRRPGAWASLVIAGALLSGAPSLAQSEPAIRFVEPRNLATVIGATTIELIPDLPEGATVERVELLIDGKPFAVLDASPWKTPWQAGDGSKGHELEAILILTDGREARTTILTSPLRINQIENVDLVNLYLVVRGPGGRYITDLTAKDFRIFEDGAPQNRATLEVAAWPDRATFLRVLQELSGLDSS